MKTILLFAAALAACNGKPPGDDAPRSVVAAQEKMMDDFEKDNPKWNFAAGKWERRSGVLAQTAETQPWAVAILEDKKFADVDVTVKFRPISGKEDASGGILFRAKDAKNYYIVRANGLEDNFRLYTMMDGSRNQLASAKVDAPKLGEWHTMRVAKGQSGLSQRQTLIDHEDKTYADGYVGLWTRPTDGFDDLTAAGSGK
jgi:hypothetical protein